MTTPCAKCEARESRIRRIVASGERLRTANVTVLSNDDIAALLDGDEVEPREEPADEQP